VAHTAVIDTHSEELSLPYQDVVRLQLEQDKVELVRDEEERAIFIFKAQEIDLDNRYTPFDAGVFGGLYVSLQR